MLSEKMASAELSHSGENVSVLLVREDGVGVNVTLTPKETLAFVKELNETVDRCQRHPD